MREIGATKTMIIVSPPVLLARTARALKTKRKLVTVLKNAITNLPRANAMLG